MADGPGKHVAVTDWDDLADGAPNPPVTGRQRERVATIFNEQSWDHVVWLPLWLLDESDTEVATVESSEHLAVGDVDDYSEKAWELAQPHRDQPTLPQYLPKSQTIVFERVGNSRIETPQRGLSAFEERA